MQKNFLKRLLHKIRLFFIHDFSFILIPRKLSILENVKIIIYFIEAILDKKISIVEKIVKIRFFLKATSPAIHYFFLLVIHSSAALGFFACSEWLGLSLVQACTLFWTALLYLAVFRDRW